MVTPEFQDSFKILESARNRFFSVGRWAGSPGLTGKGRRSTIIVYAQIRIRLGRTNMRQLAKTFKALSDETRLRILNLLIERECCVCEIMQAMGISQTRASRNLSILYGAGFLNARRNGMWVLYSLDQDKYPLIIETLKKSLQNNREAARDLDRLRNARRIGVAGICASGASCN